MKKTITLFALFSLLFTIPTTLSAQWWKFWEKKKEPTYIYKHKNQTLTGVVYAEWDKTYQRYVHESTFEIPSPSWLMYVNSSEDTVEYSVTVHYIPESFFDRNFNLLVVMRYDAQELKYSHVTTVKDVVNKHRVYSTPDASGRGTIVFLFDPSNLSKGDKFRLGLTFNQISDNDDITPYNKERKLEEYNITPTLYKHYCDVYGTIKVFPKNIPVDWFDPKENKFIDQFMTNLIKNMFDASFGKMIGVAEIFNDGKEVELPALYVIGPKSETVVKRTTTLEKRPVRDVKPQKAIPLEPLKKPEPEAPLSMLSAEPVFVDFGKVDVDETKKKVVKLQNDGRQNLNIDNIFISASSSSFWIKGETRDITLQPKKQVGIEVFFEPKVEGEHKDEVIVKYSSYPGRGVKGVRIFGFCQKTKPIKKPKPQLETKKPEKQLVPVKPKQILKKLPPLQHKFEFIREWDLDSYIVGGIAADDSGNVYAATNLDLHYPVFKIQKFTSRGELVTMWDSLKSGRKRRLTEMCKITADSSGNIYVVDDLFDNVNKFTSDGELVGSWNLGEIDIVQVRHPAGIAVDEKGFVYVTDQLNGVTKFTPDGEIVTFWKPDKTIPYTNYGSIAVYSEFVYVTDGLNHEVRKYTTEGKFVLKWGSKGSGDGQFLRPSGIATDELGYVYVADAIKNSVQKFDSNGNFVLKLLGSKENGFSQPCELATDKAGNFYVVDSFPSAYGRIHKFRIK